VSAASDATELLIRKTLRGYAQRASRPFAITRGAEHTLIFANAAFCRLTGVDPAAALGAPIAAAFSASAGQALTVFLDRAFRVGIELIDQRIEAADGRAGTLYCSLWPAIGDDGRSESLGIEIRETTAADSELDLQRSVAERMLLGALRERGIADDAEAARGHAEFLAEAGRLLAESVDETGTLIALTKVALPILGAWCIVDILEEAGGIRRLGIYHPDREKQRLAKKLEATWAPKPDDPFGAPAMLRDARTRVITKNIEATLAATTDSGENLHILRELGIGSLLTVPLVARKRLLGAITLVSAQGGLAYSQEDIKLAEDLASRAALALDNAQMYEVAQVLRRSAETANTAKTAFLGAMSHELRTPLNAIGGYIDILDLGLRGPVTAEQHADFARVKASQQHLTLLISEILNFARIGSGRTSYLIGDVNVCAAIQQAVDLVEPLFAQKGIVFDGISADTSVVARGDPEKVTQILVNLLSNAIKFTQRGGHIGADGSADDGVAVLRINDTGMGIAKRKLEAIFEPFVQVQETLASRESGVGLGLAISRDLARGMNGDLTVESVEGAGSRFSLVLPRKT
jgi:signal transduction histidine kinase